MGWGLLAVAVGIGGALWSDPRWLLLFIPAVPLIGFALHAAARGK